MKKSKKAFTLTELLVVVIVIGILSAAVLPKFNKVIETRKTTEAEELMASIRTEQEKRCALDKPYLTAMSEMTDIVKNNYTKNFTITLAARGIDAASQGKYNYTLKMPSYADGRICCEGTGCNKLNKNYPTCDELRGKDDYHESPAECAGVSSEEEPSGPCDIDPYSCECNPNQEKCCAEDEVWQDGKCSPKPKECTGPKPATSQECNKCGTQTQTVTCDTTTGEWVEGGFGECSIDDETKCEENSTCLDKFLAEELKSYCAQHGLVPWEYFADDTRLSPSNCCQSCEDAGGVMDNGECVSPYWTAEPTEKVVGIRYGKQYPTVALRSDFWGYPNASEAVGVVGQYGLSGKAGGVCDFSGYDTIAMTTLNSFDSQKFEKRCQRCSKSAGSCDETAYELGGSWTSMYDSTQRAGQSEAVCCLYANDNRGATLSELAHCVEDDDPMFSFQGEHCGDETGGEGDTCWPSCGLNYSKLVLYFTTNQIKEFQDRCAAAREINKAQQGKCTASGIPSDAYTSSGEETYSELRWREGKAQPKDSDCKVVLSNKSIEVYGAVVQKWECVKNPYGGKPLFN